MIFLKFAVLYIGILVCLHEISSQVINDRFSTRTAYRFLENLDSKVDHYSGCEQKKIWMMARHGTRFPTPKVMNAMKNNLPILRDNILNSYYEGKGGLNSEQAIMFEKWQIQNVDVKYEKMLAPEGEDELMSMGKRYRQRFNHIIPNEYDSPSIMFKFTNTDRAKESAHFFVKGLFGTNENYSMYYEAPKKDSLLRFYKHCDSWQRKMKRNPNSYKQLKHYMIGDEIMESLANISTKFGISNLTSDVGKVIYQVCAFETAWTKNFTSPWCSAFTQSNIQPFEYAEDLHHYWLNGYSNSINERLPCTISKDLMKFFSDHEGPLSAFHFTHSGAMLKTLVHFGLYKPDSHLMHDSRDPNRAWRTSRMAAFASNLAFILYSCNDGDKILALHQEKPIHMPGCGITHDLCSVDDFFKPLMERIRSCDLDEMCSMPKEKNEL